MTAISFVVEGDPVAQPRARVFRAGPYVRAVSAPGEHPIHDYKTALRRAAEEAMHGRPMLHAAKVSLLFLVARPKGKIRKRLAMPREPHTKRPDIDNYIKAVLDALTWTCWADDAAVYALEASKLIAAGGEAPRTEVVVCQA